jgi:hypothetical protein
MGVKSVLSAAALVFAGIAASGAQAGAVVLSDNFSGTPMLNWPGDGIFQSIPGPGNVYGEPSVDLVGPSTYPSLSYNGGNAIDLDGSTGTGFSPSGEIQSVMSLAKGDYTVQFELAGNLRGAPVQTVDISIGGQTQTLTLPAGQGFTLETLHFTDASGHLSFADMGPASQQGNLLADVNVTAGIPEPATWAMLILGVAMIGFAARRRAEGAALAA